MITLNTYVTYSQDYTDKFHPLGHMIHDYYRDKEVYNPVRNVLMDKDTDNYYPSILSYTYK